MREKRHPREMPPSAVFGRLFVRSRRVTSPRVFGAAQRDESAFGAEGVGHPDVVCFAGQGLDYFAVPNHCNEPAVGRAEDQRTVVEPAAAPETHPVPVNRQRGNKDNGRVGERCGREHRSSGFEQAEGAGGKVARNVRAPEQRTWLVGLSADDWQQQPRAPFTQSPEQFVGTGFGPHRHISAYRVADVNGMHGVHREGGSFGRPHGHRDSAPGGQQCCPELSFLVGCHMIHHDSVDERVRPRRQIGWSFAAKSRSALRLGRHRSLGCER